jgi:ABC-2 type transport system permease protein
VLAQLMTSEFQLRRLARTAVALGALGAGLVVNDVTLDLETIALLLLSLVCGVAIFAGLFVCAAGVQFFLINGSEVTNAFTYGGSYAAMQPASIFPGPLKLLFGFLIPVAFTAYLPTVEILGLPGTSWLPAWLAWCLPLAAAWVWFMALTVWRWGSAHYQGAGG